MIHFMAMALNIVTSFFLLTGWFYCSTMAEISPDPRIFFAEKINGNLTKITWAHAVNNRSELDAALSNDKIMMLEADVVLGTVTGSNETVPVMAHPPANESDLSLVDFLNATLKNPIRGIKLDFKSIGAFNESLPILKNIRKRMIVPLLLNADILQGPVFTDDEPVDPDEFLEGAKEHFPESVLSVGWKTQIINGSFNGTYRPWQIQEMVDKLNYHNVTQAVTYPVRAALAASDITVMQGLMKKAEKFPVTLTIWSGIDDIVDGKNLSMLIKTIGIDKTYVDVPESVWKNLDLGSSSSSTLASFGLTLVGVIACSIGCLNFL